MSPDVRPNPWQATTKVIVAAIWVLGFLYCYFSQDLPNNTRDPESPLLRSDVWRTLFVEATTVFNPFNYNVPEIDSGWSYLSQRLPFFVAAAGVWLAIWLMGRTALRICTSFRLPLLSERVVLEVGLGASLFSIWVLVCGVFRIQSAILLVVPAALCLFDLLATAIAQRPVLEQPPVSANQRISTRWKVVWFLVIAPFVVHLLLGGMTPPRDFDVREYHLQGPKEWFLAGGVTTLPHNVYTSFPFLSEMLSLSTMILMGDWWQGAIAGKLVLSGFQLLSALCVYAIARRWAGNIPGLLAAFAFVSTPWVIRISIIAYAEGAVTFYLIASLMTALLACSCDQRKHRRELVFVTGLLAGSAMAGKYPGLVSVIVPLGFVLAMLYWFRPHSEANSRTPDFVRAATLYVVAILIAVGPWLMKNWTSTGNPVYPLAYSVFGSSDWGPEMDAKWKRAHSPSDHDLHRIPLHVRDVSVRSDWQSGLLFALAVPAILCMYRLRPVCWLWLFVLWMLMTWWAFTHRIDRFWVPLIPVLAVLAGMSWHVSASRAWRGLVIVSVIVCGTYNYGFCRLPWVGFHGGLIELGELRQMPIRQDFRLLNETLPADAKVLMVGEAEVFDANFQLVYNTVFDECIFQTWTSADLSIDSGSQPMKPASEIERVFRDQKITHVVINWFEILRYRQTYGYTEYVAPDRFKVLEVADVLSSPQVLLAMPADSLSRDQKRQLESWPGAELILDDEVFRHIIMYRVRSPAVPSSK